jgi:hypothetical protein
MEPIISKEEFDELMRIKGKTAGVAIREHKAFILKEKGREGLKKLENTIVGLGYPGYRKIKPMSFYPVGLYALTLMVVKRLFNFDDKKFEEMGRFNAKLSIVIRFFMRFLISLDKAVKGVSKMWRRYYTIGSLRVIDQDERKRYGILRLENFNLHPLHCQVSKGYFSTILEMIVKKSVICEETKCVHRGDEYHEFLLKW